VRRGTSSANRLRSIYRMAIRECSVSLRHLSPVHGLHPEVPHPTLVRVTAAMWGVSGAKP